MRSKRRAVGLGITTVIVIAGAGGATAVALGLTGGDGAQSAQPSSAAPATTTGVYGVDTPLESLPPDPTHVATDEPVSVRPPADGGASVLLSFSGYDDTTGSVEVDGYLPGVAEDSGTCTLTLTRDAVTVTAAVPGTENINDTDCGGAAVPRAQLSPGTWTAVLSYSSSSTRASSEPAEVVVP